MFEIKNYLKIFLLAANRCRLLRAKLLDREIRAELWDIETIKEFNYVFTHIYSQTPPDDSLLIAVNFTKGKLGKFDKDFFLKVCLFFFFFS